MQTEFKVNWFRLLIHSSPCAHWRVTGGRRTAWLAVAIYLVSLTVVTLSVEYGRRFIPNFLSPVGSEHNGILSRTTVWDGEWYRRIATEGYSYHQSTYSSVAFFPAYPVLAMGAMWLLGASPEAALLAVSHTFLLGSLIGLAIYLRVRVEGPQLTRVILFTLLSLAFFPTTFYFRMAYTESMLLFLMILAMYGMRRGWSGIVIALIIGLATATRPVGIALLAPFTLHLWQTSVLALDGAHGDTTRRRIRRFVLSAMSLLPVACWGLLAFIFFQIWAFGEPLAFAKAQVAWGMREMPQSPVAKGLDLITLRPVFALYTPTSPCYWAKTSPGDDLLVNLAFANPIFFFGTAALVVIGAWKRWLDSPEWMLSASLLLIPYVMQARMCMASHARFASVVFPAYMVLGRLLARLPVAIAVYLLCCSALLMGAYTAFFTSWYPLY